MLICVCRKERKKWSVLIVFFCPECVNLKICYVKYKCITCNTFLERGFVLTRITKKNGRKKEKEMKIQTPTCPCYSPGHLMTMTAQ